MSILKYISPISFENMHDILKSILIENTTVSHKLINTYIDSLSFDESTQIYNILHLPLSDKALYFPSVVILSHCICKNEDPSNIPRIILKHLRDEFDKFKSNLFYKDDLLLSNIELKFLEHTGNFISSHRNLKTKNIEYMYEIVQWFSTNDLIASFVVSKTSVNHWESMHPTRRDNLIGLIETALKQIKKDI